MSDRNETAAVTLGHTSEDIVLHIVAARIRQQVKRLHVAHRLLLIIDLKHK